MTQPSVYTKESGPRSENKEKFSCRKERCGRAGKGACHHSGINSGDGHLPSCLILAWACLCCGSPPQCLLSRGLVQEDLNTQASVRLPGKGPWYMPPSVNACGPKSVMFAFTSCSSCSDRSQCPCRKAISFTNHGTVIVVGLCLEAYLSWPMSGPVLDVQRIQCCSLFYRCNLLPVYLPQASAPVPLLPNFLFSSELPEHLSLCFPQ